VTLNITVASEHSIYQCADYQYTDFATGQRTITPANQKIRFMQAQHWACTVCFNGVARTKTVNVSEWLAEKIRAVRHEDPIDHLIEKLKTADRWIAALPPGQQFHTFTIGAFIDTAPHVVLISNYEHFSGASQGVAAANLWVEHKRIREPKTIASGRGRFGVPHETKDRLKRLAQIQRDPEKVFDLLFKANAAAAAQSKLHVSRACFVTWLGRTGDGRMRSHEIDIEGFDMVLDTHGLDDAQRAVVRASIEAQLGGKRYLRQLAVAANSNTPAYWKARLLDNPNDADTYSNYGGYLADKEHDDVGAEKIYLKALEINPKHTMALNNFAQLRRRQSNFDAAYSYFEMALRASPQNEIVTVNFAGLLLQRRERLDRARTLLEMALEKHPQNLPLTMLMADLDGHEHHFAKAAQRYREAIALGGDQKALMAAIACALHASGADPLLCIGEYRTAIALQPENAALHINLAQLLFLVGQSQEALEKLQRGLGLSPAADSELEAQFYLFAYAKEPEAVIESRVDTLRVAGAKLNWNMDPTIEDIRRVNAEKAAKLVRLRDSLR
jgi:Tfp pilus assembly protein PilF